MAFGIGGEFRSPMAIAVISGLIVSTLLSLLFVPAIFILMDDLSRLMGRLFGRFIGTVDGQIITFFVMTVAAAEAAVGLAIVIGLFRHKESLNPDAFTSLRW